MCSNYHFSQGQNSSEGAFRLTAQDFKGFITSIHKGVISYGLKIIKNEFAVENITQDAYLKLWEFRNTITDLNHAKAFVKQNVKWGCQSYFRSRATQFQRQMVELDSFEAYDNVLLPIALLDNGNEMEDDLNEQRLQSAWNAISHIFYGKEKEVMELYFRKGLTNKQIALRYNLAIRTVTLIIEKCNAKLKTLLVTSPVKLKHNNNTKQSLIPSIINQPDVLDCLNVDQRKIYHLRTVKKYSFDQIAKQLNLPIAYIQKEYVKAWQTLSGQKKEKASVVGKWHSQSIKQNSAMSA